LIESRVDVEAELPAHPQLVDAVRSYRPVTPRHGGREALMKLAFTQGAQRTSRGRGMRPVGPVC